MKLILIFFWLTLASYVGAQVQFAIVCNQKTFQLELILSGKQEAHQKVVKDLLPNQAVAEAYMKDHAGSLGCNDPSKPSNVISSSTNQAAQRIANPPHTSPVNAGIRTLQYKTSRMGIYTFKPVHVEADPAIQVKQTSLPTFYLSTGKDVVPLFAVNFEMLFHYKSLSTSHTMIQTESKVYSAAGGLQGEFRIPVPVEVATPYIQASIGYMHSFYFSEYTSKSTHYKYDFNLGLIYNNLGIGSVFNISDGFGLFVEGGYTWSRTLQTLGEINNKILESQGFDPGTLVPHTAPYNQKLKGNNPYFKVGLNFRLVSN